MLRERLQGTITVLVHDSGFTSRWCIGREASDFMLVEILVVMLRRMAVFNQGHKQLRRFYTQLPKLNTGVQFPSPAPR